MNSVAKTTVIEGWVFIDIAPYVSESGGMGTDGYQYAWNLIAGAYVGVPIRISLGKLKYWDANAIRQYFSEITKASKIDIQGEEPRAIRALITELNAMTEGGWTAKPDWPERRCKQCNHVSPDHSIGCPRRVAA